MKDFVKSEWEKAYHVDAEVCRRRFSRLQVWCAFVEKSFRTAASEFDRRAIVAAVDPIAVRDVRFEKDTIQVKLFQLAIPRWGNVQMDIRADFCLALVPWRRGAVDSPNLVCGIKDIIDPETMATIEAISAALQRPLDFVFESPR